MSQLVLHLDLPAGRPLVPIEACVVLLDRSEDAILSMIEAGEIEWAWDIATAGAERRELRIWRGSLLGDPAEPWDNLFGHSRAEIRSTELQRLFSCSATHISNLCAQGLLRPLREARRGPDGWMPITRGSILTFLEARRVA